MEDDDPFDPEDAPDMGRLLEEIPLLYKVRAFADGLRQGDWFARLGEPLGAADRILAQAYLDSLGFPDAQPALLADWEDAASAAEALDFDSAAWEAEEMLRAGLVARALDQIDEEGVNAALAYVAQRTGDAARDAVEEAAALDDMAEEALKNAAMGALVQAANGAALAILAGAEEEDPPHAFLARWRLFERGRWPVGLAGATYNIL